MQAQTHILKTSNADALVNKTTVYAVFLFFNFMVTYRVLLISLIPAVELILEALYVGAIFVYLAYRAISRVVAGNFRFNSLEIYLILLFFLPVWAANGARLEFGQPLFYGVAALRDFYLIFGALIVYNMLRNKEVSMELVERMFLATAWFSILMFYFMTLFTNPKQYQDTGLAGANTAKGGDVYYRFNMAFVFLGTIYYFVKGFYHRKIHYFAISFFFLFYVVFLRFDRTCMAVLIASLGLFYLTALTTRKQILVILSVLVPGILVFLLGLLFLPQLFEQYYFMFADAMATLLGTYSAEGEESVRLRELEIALEYIAKNPITGNGKVSQQWVEGGYNYFLGFFYASDVGIYGQIFIYGFVGAIVLYGQFFFALYYALKIKHIKRNVFLVTLKFFLLALALDSITTGYLTIYAAQTVTATILIYYYYQQDRVLDFQFKMQAREKELEAAVAA